MAANIYDKLYECAINANADLCIGDVAQISDNGINFLDFSWECTQILDTIKGFFSWRSVPVWNILLKRSLIGNCEFPTDCSYWEDRVFLTDVLNNSLISHTALRFAHHSEALYFYDNISNSNSLTYRSKKTLLEQTLIGVDTVYLHLSRNQPLFTIDYGEFILELAYNAKWNQRIYQISNDDFISIFSKYKEFFLQLEPSLKRIFIQQTLMRRRLVARLLKLAFIPHILIDKFNHSL